jgi:DNA-binding response OmpR family regulator
MGRITSSTGSPAPAPHEFLTPSGKNDAVRILLVEDDEIIAEEVVRALGREGHIAEWAAEGREGLERAGLESWGLLLLDWMLPGLSGAEICRRLRASGSTVPILMLTAKDAVEDRVHGLDAGADDYLVKPFALAELLARVRSVTRRDSEQKAALIRIADLEVDTLHRTARRGGAELRLTPREYDLLEALARHSGQILTREAILERVFNDDEALPNTVNFHVSSLRKKVDGPGRPPLIHTAHGLGYRLCTPS